MMKYYPDIHLFIALGVVLIAANAHINRERNFQIQRADGHFARQARDYLAHRVQFVVGDLENQFVVNLHRHARFQIALALSSQRKIDHLTFPLVL